MNDQTTAPAPGIDIRPAAPGPTLFRIAERALNRPLLIHPHKAEVIMQVLQGRLPLDGGSLAALTPEANRFIGSYRRENGDGLSPATARTSIVTIVGSMVNRGAWIGANSGLTSYEGIAAQLRDAENDPEVDNVILDIDTPGGEATGMYALAEQVRRLRETKNVVAVVNDVAASAGYGIASAADEIVVTPTSMVGSVGVVLLHVDRSGELAEAGLKPTLIFAGAHKVDGHPFGPLPAAVRSDLQKEVLVFYDRFVATVVAGRGDRLSDADVRATEARTYLGEEAISLGLADRVGTIDDVLADLTPASRGKSSKRKEKSVDPNKTEPAADAPKGVPQAEHDTAVAAARTEGEKAGATAAQTRIAAILRSEAAKGRADQAMTLALDTTVSAEEAEKILAAAPKASGLEARASGGDEMTDGPSQSTTQSPATDIFAKSRERINARVGH